MFYFKENGIIRSVRTFVSAVFVSNPYFARGGKPIRVEVHDNLDDGIRITDVKINRIQDKTDVIMPMKRRIIEVKKINKLHSEELGHLKRHGR